MNLTRLKGHRTQSNLLTQGLNPLSLNPGQWLVIFKSWQIKDDPAKEMILAKLESIKTIRGTDKRW